ncbi:hypothetical protein QVD17_17014 [Tagetes erecta]|uniref:RlpA-like double-psi beta-barrel domain-containing protein n=1 Tax=Tagetes erecta TaxID=13708 RepID=A0AAD8KYQ6_TARER|nr:hypothetical protein QVD17_17014 [Tagetes erecta]
MKSFHFILLFTFLLLTFSEIGAQSCKPSGGIRGRKPPPGQCNQENDSDCCVQECDNQYHSDDTPVVALSTGWYKGGDRCHKHITINGNGRSVKAVVVDECDSTMGCDADHDYQPPCPNNIVDASKAVWKALGVSEDNWGDLDITCTTLCQYPSRHSGAGRITLVQPTATNDRDPCKMYVSPMGPTRQRLGCPSQKVDSQKLED